MATNKYKISIGLKFGPYASIDVAKGAQKQMKRKSPSIKFTGIKKIGKGYKFGGTMTFVKAVDAPSTAVKQHIQQQMPGASVTVTNLTRKPVKKSAW